MASNRAKETNLDQKTAQLKRIESALDEICMWLRLQNRSQLKGILEDVLRIKRDRIIYDLTNGTKSATDIARAVGVSQPRVSQIWAQWKDVGIIMEPTGPGARYRHICTLKQVGLDIDSVEDKT